jgi:cytochrome P450
LIQQSQLSPLERLSSFWLISKNPPHHTRLRGLMNKAFTPRVVEALRLRIQTIVDGLLDTVKDKGGIDIMADLAYSLPITVLQSCWVSLRRIVTVSKSGRMTWSE